jgi:hypothetical protein
VLHETTISGVYQHQLKRAPTPREYQLSIQDPTCRSQHQLRCEESNPQVQDPTCRHKTICQMYQQICDLSILHTYVCMTCLYCSTCMYVTFLCQPAYTFRKLGFLVFCNSETFALQTFVASVTSTYNLSLHPTCAICTMSSMKHLQQPMHVPHAYIIIQHRYPSTISELYHT